MAITEAGVFDIPADEYHADPIPGGSLSSSGARKLLAPSCPALFRYEQDNPQGPRKTFELGHAAHKLVLGVGPGLVLVDHEKWNTNEIKAEVAEIRECGAIPLKRAEYEQVHAMAAKLRGHPLAGALLQPDRGKAEQTLIWQDETTGVWCRALVDWLGNRDRSPRPICADYKSTVRADLDSLQKTVHSYGYNCQADWYLSGARALGWPEDTAFLFIFQEKTAPYLVTVVQLDEAAMAIASDRNRRAREIYRDCTATGIWPAYTTDIELLGLPAWAERREFEELV